MLGRRRCCWISPPSSLPPLLSERQPLNLVYTRFCCCVVLMSPPPSLLFLPPDPPPPPPHWPPVSSVTPSQKSPMKRLHGFCFGFLFLINVLDWSVDDGAGVRGRPGGRRSARRLKYLLQFFFLFFFSLKEIFTITPKAGKKKVENVKSLWGNEFSAVLHCACSTAAALWHVPLLAPCIIDIISPSMICCFLLHPTHNQFGILDLGRYIFIFFFFKFKQDRQ